MEGILRAPRVERAWINSELRMEVKLCARRVHWYAGSSPVAGSKERGAEGVLVRESRVSAESIFRSYVVAALWSSNESDETGGKPLDENYTADDIAPDTLAEMRADCEKFWDQAQDLLAVARHSNGRAYDQAGHDFWLTRNGHGVGFWDGDWSEPARTGMDRIAEAFGEYHLYVGDDGQIYGSKG